MLHLTLMPQLYSWPPGQPELAKIPFAAIRKTIFFFIVILLCKVCILEVKNLLLKGYLSIKGCFIYVPLSKPSQFTVAALIILPSRFIKLGFICFFDIQRYWRIWLRHNRLSNRITVCLDEFNSINKILAAMVNTHARLRYRGQWRGGFSVS